MAKKIDAFREIARMNANKTAGELRRGDFINMIQGLGKDCDFTDWVKYTDHAAVLCKVVAVVDVADNCNILCGWLGRTAPEHRGGSESQDVPADKHPGQFTREDYATFYQLVTIYRNTRGQWLAVDCQGYDYWRYVYMPANYRKMYAPEYAAALEEIKRRKEEREAEEAAELQRHADALAARTAELRALYPDLKEGANTARSVGANVRKFFKKHFPGFAVKVRVTANYWRNGWRVEAEAPQDTPPDIRARVTEVCEVWRDTMASGEEFENEYGQIFEAHECPMCNLFGNVEYGVTPSYNL